MHSYVSVHALGGTWFQAARPTGLVEIPAFKHAFLRFRTCTRRNLVSSGPPERISANSSFDACIPTFPYMHSEDIGSRRPAGTDRCKLQLRRMHSYISVHALGENWFQATRLTGLGPPIYPAAPAVQNPAPPACTIREGPCFPRAAYSGAWGRCVPRHPSQ